MLAIAKVWADDNTHMKALPDILVAALVLAVFVVWATRVWRNNLAGREMARLVSRQ